MEGSLVASHVEPPSGRLSTFVHQTEHLDTVVFVDVVLEGPAKGFRPARAPRFSLSAMVMGTTTYLYCTVLRSTHAHYLITRLLPNGWRSFLLSSLDPVIPPFPPYNHSTPTLRNPGHYSSSSSSSSSNAETRRNGRRALGGPGHYL